MLPCRIMYYSRHMLFNKMWFIWLPLDLNMLGFPGLIIKSLKAFAVIAGV